MEAFWKNKSEKFVKLALQIHAHSLLIMLCNDFSRQDFYFFLKNMGFDILWREFACNVEAYFFVKN